MLLAAAGQPAPYTYDSSASRKINNNNNNNSSSSNNNNNNVSAGTSTPTQTIGAAGTLAARPTTASSIASNAACALMKTLSVRLHRGTEFIKDTVQKALVMNASTPVLAPPATEGGSSHSHSHSLKRKLIGAGGIMSSVTVSSSGSGSGTTSSSSASSSSSSNRQLVLSQPYVAPTAAYLRQFTVAPSMLHRSATARKRNASTDSLLMDLCLFKPIRPMPITPIKINKARGFELKRPKFMPPAANVYSDADDDDEEEYEEDPAHKEQEQALKPKLSTLTLPQHATASAFVPHEPTQPQGHTKDSSNTLTSGTGSGEVTVTAKPKAATAKRRRRAPLLTTKRRRKTGSAAAAGITPAAKVAGTATAATAAAATAAPKRKRRRGNSISPMRHSPPMTRQRARLQISNSSN